MAEYFLMRLHHHQATPLVTRDEGHEKGSTPHAAPLDQGKRAAMMVNT